jgi:hypothetical protein
VSALLLAAALSCASAAARVLPLAEPGPGATRRGPWGVFNVLAREGGLEAFLSRPRLQPDWYASRADKLVVALEGAVSLAGTEGPVTRGELWLTPRGALQPPVRALEGPAPRLVKVHAPALEPSAPLERAPAGGPQRLSWRPAAAQCAKDPAPLCRRPLASGASLEASLLRVRGAAELPALAGRTRLLILLEGELWAAGAAARPDAALLVPAGEALELRESQDAVLVEASAAAPER